MTPTEALAEAICKGQWPSDPSDEPAQKCPAWKSHLANAKDILAALPHGWRLTDDQPSADAFRRGYAEGIKEGMERRKAK